MSTLDGHSALQPLHSRQRSITSYSRLPVNSAAGRRPDSTARSALARPRVLCSSSFVAIYEGHMVPSSFLRHTPSPLHVATDAANPPCAEKSSSVLGSHVLYPTPYLKFSRIPGESTMLPGFIRLSGSKACFSRRKACMSVDPYIRS